MADLGVLSTSVDPTLPKNAVVSKYSVTVTARPAAKAKAGAIAAVRVEGSRAVLDFGTLRTVRGLSVVGMGQTRVLGVSFWNGLAFDPSPVPVSPGTDVSFPETRTERLQVDLADLGSHDLAAAEVALADVPSDLELRIEGGPVVWSHPGPVRPGNGGWANNGTILVDLTAAVASLAGDPAGQGDLSLRLTLSSRTPAVLKIATREVLYDQITRVVPKPDELTFAAEGLQTVELPLPAGARSIREVRFDAVGTFAPERILEPVGPEVSADAELVADPDHAFCVRLPGNDVAGDLVGVRLPLRAGPDGAEVRVVLWAEADGEPAAPLDDGGSEPVALPAGQDAWTLFPFPRPVPRVEGRPLWAVLLVARGEVTWGLVEAPPGSSFQANQANELRRGGPAGPWRSLPSIFQQGGLASLRGRVRAVFLPAKATPLPALLVQLATAAKPVAEATPVPRGVPVVLRFPDLVPLGNLRVTSRAPGTVALREVDVIWSTSNPPRSSRDPSELSGATHLPSSGSYGQTDALYV
jgi:hypothetical protein